MLLFPRNSARHHHRRRAACQSRRNPRAKVAFQRTLGLEPLEPRNLLAGDSVVVFNELMYHPAADEMLEWVELHNQMAVDIDLSGWSLDDGIQYTLPEGTFIGGGDYLVVARDPGQLFTQTGYAGALGPYADQLANNGERVELRDNSDRLMDRLDFDDESPWPLAADGSWATLAKIDPDSTSAPAENWAASREVGGTPGARNFPDPLDPGGGASPAALQLNEVTAAAGGPFWLELVNTSPQPIELAGYQIGSSSGPVSFLQPGTLGAGGLRVVSAAELGFTPLLGERLFLYNPAGDQVLDAAEATEQLQARGPDGSGSWLVPDVATPGAANHFALHDEIVINEIMYDHRSQESVPGQPPVGVPDEWIELYNRGATSVDLSGWSLNDAIEYVLPTGTTIGPDEYLVVANDATAIAVKYPAIDVVGNFSGQLSNDGERIALLDSIGNPADEVHYYPGRRWPEFSAADGGPIEPLRLGSWPAFADGGGSSLELRDPDADNSVGESWEASNEWGDPQDNPWQTVTYRGTTPTNPVRPDGQWHEFVLGLLSEGAVLLDDIRVVEDPDGAATQLIQNGTFDAGNANTWRTIGNHRHSDVIADPDDPGNFVLRLAAHGSTEHMHNHVETTMANGRTIQNNTDYEISFRAKWLTGSNQLNTRLYFNRLARTTLIQQPALHGTPGEQNSVVAGAVSTANTGPTYTQFQHTPAVPAADQPVTVSVVASDPNGVTALTLRYGPADGTFTDVPMTAQGDGLFTGLIPSTAAGAGGIVQFYVEGADGLGATSTFPAAGPDSRALYQVDDGRAATHGLHNVRIVMTPGDNNWFHTDVNLMSNDPVGTTVVYNEQEIFYDVGVRGKGSERGRVTVDRLGFGIRFNPDQLFRGVHNSVLIDRSRGVNYGQREMFINQTMAHAGGLPAEYNDLIQVIAPRAAHTSAAELQLARFTDVFLDSQFTAGSDGRLFEYELIYYPTSTNNGTPEGFKRPSPDSVVGTPIRDRGDYKEDYRWHYQIKNNRLADDYSQLIVFAKEFGQTGTAFHEDIQQFIDVDQWMRAFAVARLSGTVDQYGNGSQHNAQFYIRPSDQRVLFFPHDLDFFSGSPFQPVVASNDLVKLLENPAHKRLYYGHVYDIIQTTYNGQYMAHWRDNYGSLLLGQDVAGWYQFIVDRANYVLNTAADSVTNTFPTVPFAITTNGGNDFSVDDVAATIQGDGWIDVREIRVAGDDRLPLVTWTDEDSWQVRVPVNSGVNPLTLEAYDRHGNLVGSDSITVTSTAPDSRVQEFLRISELNYHPADADPAAGEPDVDDDEFEFIELTNADPDPTGDPLDLTGVRFIEGISFDFTLSRVTSLAPGEFVLVVRNEAAFESRYGAGLPIAGVYSGRLDNGGERIWLVDAADRTVLDFTYRDASPWPATADGNGSSLEAVDLAGDYSHPATWVGSQVGGSPGQPAVPPVVDVVVNEVLSHTDVPFVDMIELYNTTGTEIDVGGWYLSDSAGSAANPGDGNFQKFRIPDGTVIPPRGYVVFDESDFNSSGGVDPNDFALSGAHGDEIWLTEADGAGNLLRFADHVEFGGAANGESFGRWPSGSGVLYPMISHTFGAANSGPRVGPLVIGEIMYHPSPPTPGDLATEPDLTEDDLEYIEIYNPTPTAVDLTDWRIRGGIDYDFAAGTRLDAGRAMVILSFDPDATDAQGEPINDGRRNAFRSHYRLHPAIAIHGGYTGRLENAGERVQLQRPDEPPLEEPNFTPHLVEDEAFYDDTAPWPTEADGSGKSLNRYVPAQWGHAANAWAATDPTPGFMRVMANPFDVAEFTSTASGFVVQFDRPFDSSPLNLHDVQAGVFGPADVTLVGNSVGPVTGSLLLAPDSITFVATGGALPADTYTVTLRSATDGFVDLHGEMLDGDEDGNPGGNYAHEFTAAPEPVVIGLPDYSRGPGQPVDVPAQVPGWPLMLSDSRVIGPGIETVDVTVDYDPALLTITGASLGSDVPAGATFTVDTGTPGRVILSISSTASPLPGGAVQLAVFSAEIPTSASYGANAEVAISNAQLAGTADASIAATTDHAVQLTAYFGDATGNGEYSGLDAQRVARVGVGLDGGLQAYPITDPRIIADISANGAISGLDAQRIALQAAGLDAPEIPSLPQPQRLAMGDDARLPSADSPAARANVEPTTQPGLSAGSNLPANPRSGRAADEFLPTVAEVAKTFGPPPKLLASSATGKFSFAARPNGWILPNFSPQDIAQSPRTSDDVFVRIHKGRPVRTGSILNHRDNVTSVRHAVDPFIAQDPLIAQVVDEIFATLGVPADLSNEPLVQYK